MDSGPDGGECPPAGPCRGFDGDCSDIAEQFASLPVLPDFPDGLAQWTCTAFPDDENNQFDSFLVGLISIAVAMPVAYVLSTCFEVANDSEAPESWLEWIGFHKLLWGRLAHRRWHYTGPHGQPRRFVRWYCRSATAPVSETAANLCRSLWAWLTCGEPPWTVEAREAAEAKEEDVETDEGAAQNGAASEAGDDCGSVVSSLESARELKRSKRTAMVFGLGCTALTWAIFVWIVFVRGPCAARRATVAFFAYVICLFPCSLADRPALAQTYGALIYRLLGGNAEESFARSWGISYAMNAVTEWDDIVQEAIKGAVVMVIMERLFLTRNASWLEDHIDYLSLQALLFKRAGLSFLQQARLLFSHSKRIT